MSRQGCKRFLRWGVVALAVEVSLAALASAAGADSIAVVVDRPVFDPALGEQVSIAAQFDRPGQATVRICDATHLVVRTLAAGAPLESGGHAWTWDGRLEDGRLAVPGTAYYPIVELAAAGSEPLVFDPAPAGGRTIVLSERECRYDARAGGVTLALPVAARVLVRAGVKDGPILKTLSSWSALPAGETTLAWDGWDSAHLVEVSHRRDFVLAARAIALPSPCVLVRGLSPTTAPTAAKRTVSADRLSTLQKALYGQAAPVAHGYLTLPAVEVPPAIGMSIRSSAAKTQAPASAAADAMTVDVAPGPGELERLASDRFEVVACVDLVPVAEDEVGHLPCTMTVPLRGVGPGRHLLSISVETASGRATTITTSFTLEGR